MPSDKPSTRQRPAGASGRAASRSSGYVNGDGDNHSRQRLVFQGAYRSDSRLTLSGDDGESLARSLSLSRRLLRLVLQHGGRQEIVATSFDLVEALAGWDRGTRPAAYGKHAGGGP